MKSYFRHFPNAGYGSLFYRWAMSTSNQPYNSYGNGAAMRISPAGWAFDSLEEVLEKARRFTEPTHNHPEGIKGAQATAAAVFLARAGQSKEKIGSYIKGTFQYDLSRSLDEIRPGYTFDGSCQGTVPQAIRVFSSPVILKTQSGTQSRLAATATRWHASPAELRKLIMPACRGLSRKRYGKNSIQT